MVCDRCKMVVHAGLKQAGLHPVSVDLGIADLQEESLTETQTQAARTQLEEYGFELLEDRKAQHVEAIKTAVIELIHREDNDSKLKQSEYIAQKLRYDYAYLSKLFSEETGTTIEQYTIHQKIERVKELLAYGEMNLSEIAWQLGYSSVAALSAQFKKVAGLTPSAWKSGDANRKTLDEVGRT